MLSHIYTNLPVNAIVGLPHPRSRDSQGQETFLAPSGDKQTRNYDIECSNQIINYINYLLYIPAFYISQHLRGQFHGKNHCCSCIGKQESKIHVFTDLVKFFYQKFLNLILNEYSFSSWFLIVNQVVRYTGFSYLEYMVLYRT